MTDDNIIPMNPEITLGSVQVEYIMRVNDERLELDPTLMDRVIDMMEQKASMNEVMLMVAEEVGHGFDMTMVTSTRIGKPTTRYYRVFWDAEARQGKVQSVIP